MLQKHARLVAEGVVEGEHRAALLSQVLLQLPHRGALQPLFLWARQAGVVNNMQVVICKLGGTFVQVQSDVLRPQLLQLHAQNETVFLICQVHAPQALTQHFIPCVSAAAACRAQPGFPTSRWPTLQGWSAASASRRAATTPARCSAGGRPAYNTVPSTLCCLCYHPRSHIAAIR